MKVDYIKPPSDGFPERTCATVTISGINIAEALISKGFATALRHRQDDDQRSSCYDDLLAAETRAIKNGKGLHSKKESPIHRVADLSGVSQKTVPSLTRVRILAAYNEGTGESVNALNEIGEGRENIANIGAFYLLLTYFELERKS